MGVSRSAYRGCLLGLAVGDAMGYPVDGKSWDEIRADYGPHGLLGYDLVNGCAEITAHTQLAAFTCNGLLLALTWARMKSRTAPYIRYIALSHKEWAHTQRRNPNLRRTYCWTSTVEELCRRRCTDKRLPDTLALAQMGTLTEPINRLDGPGSLAAAAAVGLFAGPGRMAPRSRDRLGAEAVALTHGHPAAWLAGAVTANWVSGVLREPEAPLERLLEQALAAAEQQFTSLYPHTPEALQTVRQASALARRGVPARQAMEALGCKSAMEVLAGAAYALLTCGDDFDAAMITAVNHSGRSSAVASLAGAVLGARLGLEALPEFYLECLEVGGVLAELADDLLSGCGGIDLDWDRKYLQGER